VELTRDEYLQLIGCAADRLAQAAAASENQQARAAAAIRLLPDRAEVVVHPDKPAVSVDNRHLLAALREMAERGEDGRREAAAVLDNLQHCLAMAPIAAPEEADAVLAQVLARKEFRPSLAHRIRAWLYYQLLRLLDLVIRVFPRLNLDFAGRVARIVGWAIVAVVAATILYLVVRLTVLLIPARRRPDETTLMRSEPTSGGLRTQAEWLAAAEAALAVGDHRSALRGLYMAALLRLDELGMLTFDRAATDSRVIGRLKGKGNEQEAEALLQLNRLFAFAWYGGRPAGPPEYQAAHAHWREFEVLTAS
jgi:hypothetical protein